MEQPSAPILAAIFSPRTFLLSFLADIPIPSIRAAHETRHWTLPQTLHREGEDGILDVFKIKIDIYALYSPKPGAAPSPHKNYPNNHPAKKKEAEGSGKRCMCFIWSHILLLAES